MYLTVPFALGRGGGGGVNVGSEGALQVNSLIQLIWQEIGKHRYGTRKKKVIPRTMEVSEYTILLTSFHKFSTEGLAR